MTTISHPHSFSVSIEAGRVSYRGSTLFDGLALDLQPGRWTCLLGPSGIGKTTLLRLILGLETAEAGAVTCSDGQPLAGRAAFMAQQDLLLPWLSVLDNATLGARLRSDGEASAREHAAALLERVGLASYWDARPAVLSTGMRQRVALVRTLVEDRPVVMMDEPLSALDAIGRIKLQDLAAKLLADRAVLLVTHDPLEALRLGHRVYVLAGRPARLGDAIEPGGPLPRRVDDPRILELQGELLRRLAEASP